MVYHTDVLSKLHALTLVGWVHSTHSGSQGGHTDCVRELLSSGAVVDLANKVST